ncbi:hypothetical protein SAMN06298216_0648 [Spirosomataceae bacterium TFI 002]|nr:hypothetical protein SAMN06298216_0648 [Spirosomataceae bacterium TFI 002]
MKLFILTFSTIGVAFIQVVLLFLVPVVLFAFIKSVSRLLNRKKNSVMYYHKK